MYLIVKTFINKRIIKKQMIFFFAIKEQKNFHQAVLKILYLKEVPTYNPNIQPQCPTPISNPNV